MTARVRIRRAVLDALLAEARRTPQMECCGLLAGRDSIITRILPAPNRLASATEFDVAPQDLFQLFRQMRDEGVDHLGIYHSHPAGENAPSRRDIEQAYYPEAAHFIVSPQPDAPRPVRAFNIRDGAATELQIVVE